MGLPIGNSNRRQSRAGKGQRFYPPYKYPQSGCYNFMHTHWQRTRGSRVWGKGQLIIHSNSGSQSTGTCCSFPSLRFHRGARSAGQPVHTQWGARRARNPELRGTQVLNDGLEACLTVGGRTELSLWYWPVNKPVLPSEGRRSLYKEAYPSKDAWLW